jgi:hypothetical protein
MTKQSDHEIIENNLKLFLEEMEAQPEVGRSYPPDVMPYEEEKAQIREFIDLAGEYGLAFEYINVALERFPQDFGQGGYQITRGWATHGIQIGRR